MWWVRFRGIWMGLVDCPSSADIYFYDFEFLFVSFCVSWHLWKSQIWKSACMGLKWFQCFHCNCSALMYKSTWFCPLSPGRRWNVAFFGDCWKKSSRSRLHESSKLEFWMTCKANSFFSRIVPLKISTSFMLLLEVVRPLCHWGKSSILDRFIYWSYPEILYIDLIQRSYT